MPSMMVYFFPQRLFSILIRIRCCSLLISSQTQSSVGKPQTGHISAILIL